MAVEAMIRRVPKGGTRSIKALARQLGYLSRQTDENRPNIILVGAQRHQFNPGTPDDAVDPNNVRAFARGLYLRSARLPPDNLKAELENDLTMHFVISFPHGTDPAAAERAGRDWAESVFGLGFRNGQGAAQQHDYVTAFHNHGAEHNHPHMHVVVDRVPLGGGNLLTLSRGHVHWSYEAMRLEAVDAAATHGIVLVATPHAPTNMTRPITQEEAERRRDAARKVPYHDPIFDEEDQAPGAKELSDDPTLENVQQTCEPVDAPEPYAGNGPGDDHGSNGGGRGNNPDTGRGGGAPPHDQSPGPSNFDQDFDMGDDDGGAGPSGVRQEPPSPDQAGQTQPVADPANQAQAQVSPLAAARRAIFEARMAVVAHQQAQPNGGSSEDRRNWEAEAQRLLRVQSNAVAAEHRIRDMLIATARARAQAQGRTTQTQPVAGPSRSANNQPSALTAENLARLNQINDTQAAERARQAQRSAQRDQREQENENDDNRRRKTPERSESPLTPLPSTLSTLTPLPSTRDGTAPTSQERAQVSPLDAAKQALDNARAAEHAHQQARPQDGSEEALRDWRAGVRQRAEDTQRARTALNVARYGGPNVTTRSRAGQNAGPNPGPGRAAAERGADAARQAQADQRRANRAQREREVENQEEDRRRRTPVSQEQQQNLSPEAARQALTNARMALEAHRQTRPNGGSEEAAQAWRTEHQRRRGEVRDADAALQTARYGRPNVTTRAQAQAQPQEDPNRNTRNDQRDRRNPGPSRSNNHRSN